MGAPLQRFPDSRDKKKRCKRRETRREMRRGPPPSSDLTRNVDVEVEAGTRPTKKKKRGATGPLLERGVYYSTEGKKDQTEEKRNHIQVSCSRFRNAREDAMRSDRGRERTLPCQLGFRKRAASSFTQRRGDNGKKGSKKEGGVQLI